MYPGKRIKSLYVRPSPPAINWAAESVTVHGVATDGFKWRDSVLWKVVDEAHDNTA